MSGFPEGITAPEGVREHKNSSMFVKERGQ
jgi:hypothetical protein